MKIEIRMGQGDGFPMQPGQTQQMENQKYFLRAEAILRYLVTDDEQLNNLIIFRPAHVGVFTDDQQLYEALGSIKPHDDFRLNKLTKFMETVDVHAVRERTRQAKYILKEERVEELRKGALAQQQTEKNVQQEKETPARDSAQAEQKKNKNKINKQNIGGT